MNVALEAGVAIYVAMAVALSVWIGIFVYLWRIDAQARMLRRELERERAERGAAAERPDAPSATVTRVRPAAGEPVEK
jgi:CcmD family protein